MMPSLLVGMRRADTACGDWAEKPGHHASVSDTIKTGTPNRKGQTMSGESRFEDTVKLMMIVLVLGVAVFVAIVLLERQASRRPQPGPTPTPTQTSATVAPRAPVAGRGGYQGTGYPACLNEDASAQGGTGPCVLDCETAAMDQWCRPDQRGLWLRWPESLYPDRPVRTGD